EVKAAIGFEPRHGNEVVLAIRIGVVRVALVAGPRDQLAVEIERPGVIEAAEQRGAALFLATHHGAAMWAGVEIRANFTILVARENQLAAAHVARQEIPGICDFRLVAEIEPALSEDVAPLRLEHALVDKDPARDPEDSLSGAVVDQRALHGCLVSHANPPGHRTQPTLAKPAPIDKPLV